MESKNHHVVRKHDFYWRYDTTGELDLLNPLWPLVSLRLNIFTPTRKPTGYATSADGRRKRLYDSPTTPWQRLQDSGILTLQQTQQIAARLQGINPGDPTREITHIPTQLTDLAAAKTHTLTKARHLDLTALTPSITRLQKTTQPQAPTTIKI